MSTASAPASASATTATAAIASATSANASARKRLLRKLRLRLPLLKRLTSKANYTKKIPGFSRDLFFIPHWSADPPAYR